MNALPMIAACTVHGHQGDGLAQCEVCRDWYPYTWGPAGMCSRCLLQSEAGVSH